MQQQQFVAATMSDSANSSDEASVSEVEDNFSFQDISSANTDNILSMYIGNSSTSLDDLHIHC